ncbi:MAG: N-succinylarginine dihydrolase [Robiginitomaculum sp.]|nr:MAG: N-succinylarginine dihydrolase [Robiginitomaculum sp.]
MAAMEANYDGLVGLTHNYGGLSAGNLASAHNVGQISRPREGALQGLSKMKRLYDAGLVQGILPPHERPFLPLLHEAGFAGSDAQIIENAARHAPALLQAVSSSAFMWAANAATISPSADTSDGRLHASTANLVTMLHRSIEGPQTERSLHAAFPDDNHFCIHAPLPMQESFGDEGAANHVRLCADHGDPGVEIFVHGRLAGFAPGLKFPARQTLQANQALARRHGLNMDRVVFAAQAQSTIEAGAFHNDVVCVGAKTCLFFHEYAFADTTQTLEAIRRAADRLFEPQFVQVNQDEVPLRDAITSYLFNSMLVEIPGEERLVLIAPAECRKTPSVAQYCDKLVAGNGPIGRVEFVDVRQSMRNGGGPACLRLRVVLSDAERAAANPDMLMSETLYAKLTDWVRRHYREQLAPADLVDPSLLAEGRRALDELTTILSLGSDFYPFQRA